MPADSSIAKALIRDLRRGGITVNRAGNGLRAGWASASQRQVGVPRGIPKPLAILAHEAGHFMPTSATTVAAHRTAERTGSEVKDALALLRQERDANRGAQKIISTYGGSRSQRRAYREALAPGYASYRNNVASAAMREANPGDFARHDERARDTIFRDLPRTASHHSATSASEANKVIEKIMKRDPQYVREKRAASYSYKDELRKTGFSVDTAILQWLKATNIRLHEFGSIRAQDGTFAAVATPDAATMRKAYGPRLGVPLPRKVPRPTFGQSLLKRSLIDAIRNKTTR